MNHVSLLLKDFKVTSKHGNYDNSSPVPRIFSQNVSVSNAFDSPDDVLSLQEQIFASGIASGEQTTDERGDSKESDRVIRSKSYTTKQQRRHHGSLPGAIYLQKLKQNKPSKIGYGNSRQ